MKDRIEDCISKLKHRCDYLEIRIEEFMMTQIGLRGPKVDVLQETKELGGCARGGISREVSGSFPSTIRKKMDVYAGEAIEQARLAGRSETVLADVSCDPR